MMLVWVDAWQMQCCGDPFAVGARVEWTLYEQSDSDWLTAVLGADLAREVTHREEHHDDPADDAVATIGRVRRIRAVSCKFGPDPDGIRAGAPVNVPIPGTGLLADVTEADGWYPETAGLVFNGYLVELRRMEG